MIKRKIPTTRATAEGIGEVLETFKERFVEYQGEQKVCNDVQVAATFNIITNGQLVEDMQ